MSTGDTEDLWYRQSSNDKPAASTGPHPGHRPVNVHYKRNIFEFMPDFLSLEMCKNEVHSKQGCRQIPSPTVLCEPPLFERCCTDSELQAAAATTDES